jgi:hypothetical protein|tara:strand:+ start:2702 stop:2980 length:279 start_codon:yes stop_codon:yes gene_type:complete
MTQNPLSDEEVVRQMKLLDGVDETKVSIPVPDPEVVAAQRAKELGRDFLSPDDAPELFGGGVGGGQSSTQLSELIDLVRDLPSKIATELRNM